MGYYDWPAIFKKYSDSELKKVYQNKHTEQEEKVSAALEELIKRGFIITNNNQSIEENYQFIINDKSVCYYCKTKGLRESEKYCPNCAFPQGGTEAEMRAFVLNVKKKEELLESKKKAITKARVLLYVLAGLNLIIGLILGLFVSVNIPVLIACGIGAIIYLLLGAWSENQPFPAILSGFFVYLVFNIMSAFADPNTIYKGLILKILIITWFVYGFKGAIDSRKLERDLQSIKKAEDIKTEN